MTLPAVIERRVQHVAIGAVWPSAMNPRTQFGEESLQELEASIREHGILEPLLVRPHPQTGSYEIIAGCRRLKAAERAGLARVPVIVHDVADREMVLLMLVENLQREGLNEMDECDGYWKLHSEAGLPVEAIASRIGKSPAYVYARLKLRDLAPAVQDSLRAGKITASHALVLATRPKREQAKKLPAAESSTVRELTAAIRPMRTIGHVRGAGAANDEVLRDVVARCWRCRQPLDFGTDGNGYTTEGCTRCWWYIHDLEQEVRKLKARLAELNGKPVGAGQS